MAINNLMPPVQLKRPAAPVTDINKMIEDLNLQLTTPTVQQAAPQTPDIAELLKQKLAEQINTRIKSLAQPTQNNAQQVAQPAQTKMSRPDATRDIDKTPILPGSAGMMAFAKTAQTMNNIKAMNEARDYKDYQDETDLNRAIEKMSTQNEYRQQLEELKNANSLEKITMNQQFAARNDELNNAIKEATLAKKLNGSGPGRPAGAAVTNSEVTPNGMEKFLGEKDFQIWQSLGTKAAKDKFALSKVAEMPITNMTVDIYRKAIQSGKTELEAAEIAKNAGTNLEVIKSKARAAAEGRAEGDLAGVMMDKTTPPPQVAQQPITPQPAAVQQPMVPPVRQIQTPVKTGEQKINNGMLFYKYSDGKWRNQ